MKGQTLELIPGDPPQLRLTLKNEAGVAVSAEFSLDEADAFFCRGIAMARRRQPKNFERDD